MAPITKFSFDTDFDTVDASDRHVVEEETPLPEPMPPEPVVETDLLAHRMHRLTHAQWERTRFNGLV